MILTHTSRILRALVALAVLALALGGPIGSAWAAGADTTITVEVNGKVPVVDVSMIGVFTYDINCLSRDSFVGAWAYDGTVNGIPVSSTGEAEGTARASSLDVTITAIDTWDMGPVGRPGVPISASARGVGDLVYLTFNNKGPFPAAIQPALSNPCNGGATMYRLTTPGAGSDVVSDLPNTGLGYTSQVSREAGALPALWLALAAAGLVGVRVMLSITSRAR